MSAQSVCSVHLRRTTMMTSTDPVIYTDDTDEFSNDEIIACSSCQFANRPKGGLCAFPQNIKKNEKVNGKKMKGLFNALFTAAGGEVRITQ
jgi:hypothetical protein